MAMAARSFAMPSLLLRDHRRTPGTYRRGSDSRFRGDKGNTKDSETRSRWLRGEARGIPLVAATAPGWLTRCVGGHRCTRQAGYHLLKLRNGRLDLMTNDPAVMHYAALIR